MYCELKISQPFILRIGNVS